LTDYGVADTVHLFCMNGDFLAYLFQTYYSREMSVLIQCMGMSRVITFSYGTLVESLWFGVLSDDSLNNAVSHPRRLESSAVLLWEPT
jgi:hypothetical protein